jgi:hypothetical protein
MADDEGFVGRFGFMVLIYKVLEQGTFAWPRAGWTDASFSAQ